MSKEKRSTNPSLLRSYAEEMLLKNPGESQALFPFTSFSESDLLKLVHELDVHKIELEMKLDETERITAELMISNTELAFQNEEKSKLAEELVIANKEIVVQAELILANSYLENMLSHANGPIIILDTKFCITRFNPAFEFLTGRSEAEVLGKHLATLFPPALVVDSMVNILKTLNGERWDAIELEILHLDGSVRTVLWYSSTLYTPDGLTQIATIAQGQDITDRKNLEADNATMATRYQTMVQTSTDGIHILDKNGNVIECNEAFCNMLGYTHEEILNLNVADWDEQWKGEELIKRVNDLMIHPAVFETRQRCKDGSSVDVEINASGILLDGSQYQYAASRNITDRKLADNEILQINEELQKINSEKDKFFSIIAHDLRGPLGNFMGMTEMLTDESYNFPESERKKMIEGLSHSARNTFTLLENLLEWAQMVQGLTEFKPQKLELTQAIAECISTLEESAKVKRIELLAQIDGEQFVIADKNMLQSVIRNLISNAVKFTPNGGKVNISAESSANHMVMISVKDNGIGMTREILSNLFHIDADIKRPGTNNEKSTGLGLLLCKEFVEKLGGKITVESEPNKGTVFSFYIPANVKEGKAVATKKTVSEVIHEDKIGNLNILIAEDDEISMKLFSLYVGEFSKKVYFAKNGDEAIRICHENRDIDLVLMDIEMPLLDGYEASRRIREFNKTVIIIAQTAFFFARNKEKALAAGINDYIMKPIRKPAFIELIKKHIRR
ncbi:MAG: PAS domain S-box protein [Bacteroidia bacterium]